MLLQIQSVSADHQAMFRQLVLILFLISVVKCELHPVLTHRGVVGGYVLPRNHPHTHQISLRQSGGHVCGGSIITNRLVLTAAHCVYKMTVSLFTVVVGISNQRDAGKVYLPKRIEIHRGYSQTAVTNDIAVIITQKEIAFNERVQPIPLYDSMLPDGSACTATGWGNVRFEGPMSQDLKAVDLIAISNAECNGRQPAPPSIDAIKQICTLKAVGQGVCMGDSGGPLVADGKLVGIVSWGRRCASGYPDVFTRVFGYLQWINGIVV